MLREQDKHFLWSLFIAMGVIFTWKGLWDAVYEIPYIGNEWVALFIGFAILTFSGIIFKEFDPLSKLEKTIAGKINSVMRHPHRKEFRLEYFDKVKGKKIIVNGKDIRRVEKGVIILRHKSGRKELFIPFHRVNEVIYKGKTYWKL